MRRTAFMVVTLLLLLALPVAVASADKSGEPERAAASASASIDPASAVGLTDTRATLVARVVPNVKGASATFEYGPTSAYGATAAALPAILPEKGATASASVDGLAPATTYHFRVVLTIAGVTLPGLDATFTTAAAPAPQGDEGSSDGDESSADDDAPAPVQAPAAPVLGKSVAVGPRDGTVRVRRPHGKRFEPLTTGATVPPGSVVDASAGTVALTSALDGAGNIQTGEFRGGQFVVRQSKRGGGMVDIYLRGSIGSCKAGTARLASVRKPGRRLWGRDKGGRFRTHGADSVAAVRGTRWLTEDTCAGTRTKVTEGVVVVRDTARKRTVTVRAGHSYLARRPR
jgi:hypothetical protein